MPPILQATDLAFGFPGRPDFLRPISLAVEPGDCWGVIGPNGAGKSTLLRLLAGLLTPASGEVHLDGRPLGELPARLRARRVAFLPQHAPGELAALAREVVLLGRYPHRRFGLFESAADLAVAERAMAATGTAEFADRPLATLSGGEAQRVHLAAALAQQPAVLLLDEPTASLDLYHQLSIFTILQDLTARARLAVVVVTHDVNLAARYCSHVLLLDDGRPVASGPPAEVIHPGVLRAVYRVELASATTDDLARRWIVPLTPHRAAGPGPGGAP